MVYKIPCDRHFGKKKEEDHEKQTVVMEKSPIFFKARALGFTRALKLITRAFPGFADPIDFTNVTPN